MIEAPEDSPGNAQDDGIIHRRGWHHRLYWWVLSWASHPQGTWALAALAFAESSFFPIPPDVMLVPMILARREQAYWIATVCTVSSVLGGVLGYAIGYFLYDSVGLWLVNLYGAHDAIGEFRAWYDHYGAWVILIKGLTPIPFKIVTIASGTSPACSARNASSRSTSMLPLNGCGFAGS